MAKDPEDQPCPRGGKHAPEEKHKKDRKGVYRYKLVCRKCGKSLTRGWKKL
jgi:hypothetical protein